MDWKYISYSFHHYQSYPTWIPLTLDHHLSLSVITLGKSSRQHPVYAQYWLMSFYRLFPCVLHKPWTCWCWIALWCLPVMAMIASMFTMCYFKDLSPFFGCGPHDVLFRSLNTETSLARKNKYQDIFIGRLLLYLSHLWRLLFLTYNPESVAQSTGAVEYADCIAAER